VSIVHLSRVALGEGNNNAKLDHSATMIKSLPHDVETKEYSLIFWADLSSIINHQWQLNKEP